MPGNAPVFYQPTAVTIQGRFQHNLQLFDADLTSLLASLLRVEDENVASLSTQFGDDRLINSVTLNGNSPGTTVLTIGDPSALATSAAYYSQTTVTVSDVMVRPAWMRLAVISQLLVIANAPPNPFQTVGSTVQVARQLAIESQEATVLPILGFNDMKFYAAVGSSGFTLESVDPTVLTIGTSGSTIVARGTGMGQLVRASWISPCGIVVNGTGLVDIQLPSPTGMIITGLATTLAEQGNAARQIYPVQSFITVQLVFNGGRLQDVTNDPRTVYDDASSDPSDLIRVTKDGLGQPVVATSGLDSEGTSGQATLVVRFDYFGLTATQIISVVRASNLALQAVPYPQGLEVNPLNPIGSSGVYQQASLVLTMELSNSQIFTVSDHPLAQYSATSSSSPGEGGGGGGSSSFGVSLSRTLVSVVETGDYTVNIDASFDSLRSNTFELQISSRAIGVANVIDVSFPSTLRGATLVTTAQARCGLQLADDTVLTRDYLFGGPGGSLAISGLLDFSLPASSSSGSAAPATSTACSIDGASGVVTLRGNSPENLVLRIAVRNSNAMAETSFAANLDPQVGDVDIGNADSLAIPVLQASQSIAVPVRINVGSFTAATVKITFHYNQNILSVVGVSRGADWPGGTFGATINDPPGVVSMGGPLNAFSGLKELFTISFQVVGSPSATDSTITGFIETLADPLGNNLPSQGQLIVAGAVPFRVFATTLRRREAEYAQALLTSRSSANVADTARDAAAAAAAAGAATAAASAVVRSRRTSDCATPPCLSCGDASADGSSSSSSAHPKGDANGDCAFELKDATFTRRYLLESSRDPTYASTLLASQLANLDADGNGAINPDDADFMTRVDFKLLRFVSNLVVQSDSCTVNISVDVSASTSRPNQTIVFFDMDSTDSSLTAQLASSELVYGRVSLFPKPQPSNGAVVRAQQLSDTTFGVSFRSSVVQASVGLSLILVTTDSNGASDSSRVSSMLGGNPLPPYSFSGFTASLEIDPVSHQRQQFVTAGYNPFLTVHGLNSSLSACNLCLTSPCKNQGTCVQTSPSSFECDCLEGFTGSDCAQNVDECSSPTTACLNGGQCADLFGSYQCNCSGTGYTSSRCEVNVDECLLNNGGCLNGGVCVDSPGSHSCNCSGTGYQGEFCQDNINECQVAEASGTTVLCYFGGRCIDSPGSYSCNCTGTGYEGSDCRIDTDECSASVQPPCLHGGLCINYPGGYICNCSFTGYSGANCENNINECLTSQPCLNSGVCADTDGSFTCDCNGTGYTGNTCAQDINECETTVAAVEGGKNLDGSDITMPSGICQHGGMCTNTEGGYSCNCAGTGYQGLNCSVDIDECTENNGGCLHGSLCINAPGSFACNCSGTGYQGLACADNIDECATNTHSCVHGACVDQVGTYSCNCTGSGFEGPFCAADIDECTVISPEGGCLNFGNCVNEIGSYHCNCDSTGFTGANCSIDINECQINNGGCLHSSSCLNYPGGFACNCTNTGYSGEDCSININECDTLYPCVNGQCIDTLGSYMCNCTGTGFTGARCDVNVNECATNNGGCLNGGVCVDTPGSFYCNCQGTGYEQQFCQQNINECLRTPSPCNNGGRCTDLPGNYSCNCTGTGYFGPACSSDINECAVNPCAHGTCFDLVNGYQCRCNAGYQGVNCSVNIDDCAGRPCYNGATCTDLVNGFNCTCAPGWSGPLCDSDINECASSPCANGGTCSHSVASYSCACAKGYSGPRCLTGERERQRK